MSAFPTTLKLAFGSMIIAVLFGIPFGIISAIKQYSWFDSIAMIFAMVGISMPVFWLGILLILFFLYTLAGFHRPVFKDSKA